MNKVLSDISRYVADKVGFQFLNAHTYIGMDNLLPNRGGVTASEYVPSEGQFTAFRKGDILLGNIRPYFKKIWLAEYDGGCSPDVLCIRAKAGVSPLFLYAVLAQDAFFDYDFKGAKGSKMPRGDKDHIMAFPVPEIENEEEVGFLVDSIYRKIQSNVAICYYLESMAKLLYDHWFVQFDFPDENGKPYKSSGGKMVWNEELKRKIPAGWEVELLRDVLDLLKDGTHNPPERIEHGIPLLTGTMFGHTFLDYSQATFIAEKDYRSIHSQYAPKESDIVLTKIGTLGNVNYLRDCDVPIAIHCNSALLRFPSNMQGMFSYVYCKSDEFQKRLRAAKGQSVQEFCSLDSIGTVLMLLPEERLIRLYQSKMEPVLQQMIRISNENQQLASLRDFLLPMLMNGQVTVGGTA